MYQWLIILSVVCGTIAPLLLQKDIWPFSTYSMFSSNLTNSKLIKTNKYQLLGINQTGNKEIVKNQTVTGAIHPGMLSFAVDNLVNNNKMQCLDDLLTYWGRRYKSTVQTERQQIERLAIIRVNSERDDSFYIEKNIIHEFNKK